MSIIVVFDAIILFGLLFAVLYYYFLLAASMRRTHEIQDRNSVEGHIRFAVVIPAHNEASVIGPTVSMMLRMDYNQELFDVVVIADNCDDATASISRNAGAICYEREDRLLSSKGFALAWYFDRVLLEDNRYDAVVVFDADSQPLGNYLSIMSSSIQSGTTVLQGQHIISNPDESVFARLADIDMRLNNRLRNLARNNLGLSCRLMGDGMCFERTILESYPWKAFSMVEDREFGIQLIKQGVHVNYVPEAESRGQAAVGWAQAKSQRMRWSGGVLSLRKRHAFSLMLSGIQNNDLSAIDRAIELLLPPYSILLIVSIALLLLHTVFPSLDYSYSLALSIGNVVAWLLIPVIGLILDRAPAHLFPYMALGPVYALWRSWLIILTLIRRDQLHWVRTRRREE